MPASVERKVAQLVNALAERKERVQTLVGERNALLKGLEALGCKSVLEAERQIVKLEEKLKQQNQDLARMVEKIEHDWEWE